jgi:hypothetical protein
MLELGFPFLKERAHAFFLILCREPCGKRSDFQGAGGNQVDVDSGVDQFFDVFCLDPGFHEDFLCEPFRFLHEFFWFDNLVDQSDAQCFCRVDRIPGEQQLLCFQGTDEPGEPLGASEPWVDAKVDLRLSYLCCTGGDDEVAGHHDFTAAAKRVAVHCGDVRQAGLFNAL